MEKEPSLTLLQEELETLHKTLEELTKTFYDEKEEKLKVSYPNNSEGRQLKQAHFEIFNHLEQVRKQLEYFSQPIADTGILKYDHEKEGFVFKSLYHDFPLVSGMTLEVLVEDYFTEEKHWMKTRLDYLPQSAGEGYRSKNHSYGWYVAEDKELQLEGAKARLRKK